MFVGHYSAALAAKAVEPRGPLWLYVGAAQLVDIAWGALVMAGVEKVRVDPSLPGSTLDLHHMPWTHSLPAAGVWSLAAIVLSIQVLKLPFKAAFIVGLVVFSHWGLDFLVHRPDLLLWPGDEKVGLGWWNYPVPEQALEIGLLALAGMAWAWDRGLQRLKLMPALLFVGFLVALQVAAMFAPPEGNAFQIGLSALVVYLVVMALAWPFDRKKRGRR